ncbi:hypothetical protein N7G274_003798 [Stereocaulon virgatum]|uniref:Uncharacterized protein n=1 Tax=Stereocaulon virgatum TaxID=373712 RepID=A0ABR4AF75_9LECA
MGRAIVSRTRTGAFQERAQREQPHHHGGHPRSTEIPTALTKVTKAKETKAEEQDRINNEGLFIQVIIYDCRWKQITVRGKDYSWEQIKNIGEGMDYGSVYIKWDTAIRGWKECIHQHMLPQTPQWEHNPRVHTDIEIYGLGVMGIGREGHLLVGASLGLESATTTNELLSYFPVLLFLFLYLLYYYHGEAAFYA